MAEESLAQWRAGYATRLLHVPAEDVAPEQPFAPRVGDVVRTGIAELASPAAPIRTRLLAVRGLAAVDPVAARIGDLDASRVDELLVVVDAADDPSALDAARASAGRMGAGRVRFVPTGPFVRERADAVTPGVAWDLDDWRPVVDVDRFSFDRSGGVVERPVVGCLGRDDCDWPGSAADGLSAGWSADDVRVRVLANEADAMLALGGRTGAVEVVDAHTVSRRRFLRMIDVFVCFADDGQDGSCELPVLEALASGAVTILPPRLARVFGDAALYCPPWDIRSLVTSLAADPGRFVAQSSRGRRVVRERFDHAAHERRVRALIGAPRPSRLTAATMQPAAADRTSERMLFVSSNGAGLGHLTRLMSVARRLPDGYEAVFATQSQAVAIVRDEGYRTEYIPSNPYLGSDSPRWNRYLRSRLDDLLASYDPALVLVDAPVPYSGLLATMGTHEHVPFVWLRRPMWRQGLGAEWLRRGAAYDAVVEPGEFAASVDTGPTVGRDDAQPVDPIVYLDDDELLDREQACAELGLDPRRPAALVQLGAGNINDVVSDVGIVTSRLLRQRDLQVVLARSPISVQDLPVPDGIRSVQVFPMSRWLRAFDLTVSAAGYNSYHELIRFGVPTLFLPNIHTQLDDQVARALFAQDEGVGLCVQHVTRESADRALSQLMDPAVRRSLAQRCLERRRPNGAQAAADAVVTLAGGGVRAEEPRRAVMRKTA